MPFKVIIPARYASTRLPGKMLMEINGKPMIQHVYVRALESGAEEVIIATDDERIQKTACDFGASVCMTDSGHTSGTDRIAEAATGMSYSDNDIIVNVQGDEPFIPPVLIRQVAEDLGKYSDAQIASLCEPIHTLEALFDPNHVKVVIDNQGYALYFSRAPIAWDRDHFQFPVTQSTSLNLKVHFRHIGIYAYRASFLKKFTEWGACDLEQTEKLEQLRLLWNGGRIHLTEAKDFVPPDVNTIEDLEALRLMIQTES